MGGTPAAVFSAERQSSTDCQTYQEHGGPFGLTVTNRTTLHHSTERGGYDSRAESDTRRKRSPASAKGKSQSDVRYPVGEILSLQWKDVNLDRRELLIRAEKSKTRTGRIVPISGRLLATFEVRKLDPAGQPLSSDTYVFGDAIGRR